MSNIFSSDFDIDKAAAELDKKIEAQTITPAAPAADYVVAMERFHEANAALKKALADRDIMLASWNEQIRILRLRVDDARKVADSVKVKRPRGRPPLVRR